MRYGVIAEVLAVTASTRSTPLSRSKTTGSPVRASTAGMSTRRSGHRVPGSREATTSRQRDVPESSAPMRSNAAAPIRRRMSAGSDAAATTAFDQSR